MTRHKRPLLRIGQLGLFGVICILAGCFSDEARLMGHYLRSIRTMRLIQAAERSYYQSRSRYAGAESLGISGLRVLDPGTVEDPIEGYVFRIDLSGQGYQVRSWPALHSTNLFHSLYSDETEVIRAHFGADLATARSPRIDGVGP